jgi:hypothetical protein
MFKGSVVQSLQLRETIPGGEIRSILKIEPLRWTLKDGCSFNRHRRRPCMHTADRGNGSEGSWIGRERPSLKVRK